MTIKVQFKRSAVKDKVPLPADLEYGELAVNYNKDSVRLYTKASDNTVAEVGGGDFIHKNISTLPALP
jgi:hypothetical protein